MGAIIFASMATTSIAFHNLLCHLALNPRVCDKLYEEQKEVMALANTPDPEREQDAEIDSDPTYSKFAMEKAKYLEVGLDDSFIDS